VQGFGVLRDVVLDLGDYECGEIVQLAGPNGAGKTTLLELAIPGAVYRQCPTRGSLRDLARERDSNLDVSLSHAGKVYHIRHVVDAVSGKSEALLLGADGLPLYDTTKVRDFAEWSERTFIAPEVLLACTFGSQASGGFLAAKPTERKAILLRSLGLEAWETRAERAAEKAKAVDVALTKARAKLEALGANDPGAEQRATEAAERLTGSNQRLAAARQALALFEGDLQRNQELHERRLALTGEHGRLVAELSFANDRRKSLLQDIADVRAAMGEADAIREANARLTAITAELEQLRDKRATAAATLQSVKRELRALPLPNGDAQRDLGEATSQLQSIETARTVQSEELDRLIALHADAVAELRARDGECTAFRAQFESLSATRINGLRGGLTSIARQAEKRLPALTAELALEADDALVSATTEERLTALTTLREDAAQKASDAKRRKDSAELSLERLQLQWDDASRRVARLRGEVEDAQKRAVERERKVTALEEQLQRLQAELDANTERSDALSAEAETLKPLAAKLLVLEKATATLAGLEGSLARESSRAEVDAARAADIVEQLTQLEHAKLPSSADSIAQRHVLQQEVDAANAEHNDNHGAYAEAKLGWERQQATAADRIALTSQVASLELELSDWARLKDDLGKNGIQAAEIDGALDDLNVLVNDLLHECHSSRWTVRLDTQRLSGDGKRMIETLDVVILDTETGREGKAETFSGGERAILGEALALALTMVACRRAGLERPTLVRDESGAALDPANARAYIAMLRRAAKYVEASCVLVVSHQPDIAELCDARIEVTQGRHVASLPQE
jgi:DNA repair exonuclease SbcCD ATPase subunit